MGIGFSKYFPAKRFRIRSAPGDANSIFVASSHAASGAPKFPKAGIVQKKNADTTQCVWIARSRLRRLFFDLYRPPRQKLRHVQVAAVKLGDLGQLFPVDHLEMACLGEDVEAPKGLDRAIDVHN
jgi:hypothetical protein